jgi:NADPH-dependent ferric siderophore reductase
MTSRSNDLSPAQPVLDHGRRNRESSQLIFRVVRREQLAPHLVRIDIGGPAFDEFMTNADPERLGATDRYVKILFARPELGLVPPFDFDALRERLHIDDLPVRRTYTVRSVNTEAKTLSIDFVVHGDDGVAGPWAATAQTGDTVVLSGPGGGYRPSLETGVEYLFIGDTSALPAIASALESLATDAIGSALIEVESEDDELPLNAPAGVTVRWLHRNSGERSRRYGAALVEAVHQLGRPAHRVEVFAHGEREAIKAVREIIQDGWGLERRTLSLSAYWAQGRSEDRFQSEKRLPVGQIFADSGH